MRRHRSERRLRGGDPRFNNVLITRMINAVMRCGKKSVAERVVYGAFDRIAEKNKDKNPMDVLQAAMDNVKPKLEVKSRRVGGANYQVPIEVRPERRFILAVRWIIGAARSKKGKPMADKLADELMAAAKNEGAAIKKKLDMHRMAEANRAFAHFAK